MTDKRQQGRHIFSGMIRIASGTMLSRVAGFSLMLVIADYYGATRDADVFALAFWLANLFRMVVGERALESAFLPTFKGLLAQGKHRDAWQLGCSVFHLVLISSVVLGVLLAICAPHIMKVLGYGFSPEEKTVAVSMARLIMPFLVLIALAAFFGTLLLAFERYTWYGLAPAMFGIGAITGIFLLYEPLRAQGCAVYALAGGVLLGGFLQLIVQVPVIFSRKIRLETVPSYHLSLATNMPELRQVGWLLVPILASALIEKLGAMVDRSLASGLVEGSVAALWYAFRVVSLPFALVGLGLGRSALPLLSEKAAKNDLEGFGRAVFITLKFSTLLLIPATAVAVVVRVPLVKMLFQRGNFTEEGVRLTTLALWCYAVGLVPMAWVSNLSRAFHALKDTRTPLVASAIGLMLNVILNFILVRTSLRVGGLALATSISMAVTAGLMLWLLAKKLKNRGISLELGGHESWWICTVASTTTAFGVGYAVRWLVFGWITGDGMWYSSLRFLLPALGVLAAYAVSAVIQGLTREALPGLTKGHQAR